VGGVQTISWDSTGSIGGSVKLEYSINDGGKWNEIESSISNTGSYSWTIPDSVTGLALVRVSDAVDADPADTSDQVFSIVPIPTLTVLSPNGNEQWEVGSVQDITWDSTGIIGNVKLEYTINDGVKWNEIVVSTLNDGTYSWTIPDSVTDLGLVRVSDAVDGSPTDESDVDFSIIAATFNMAVGSNWNMIGLPLDVDNGNYLDLFPNAIPNTLYGFDGSYVLYDTLRLSKGYWLRFSAGEGVNVIGYPVNSNDLNLNQGWNMISGISCDVALSDLSDPGNIIIPGTLYGFEQSYVLSDTIKQGKGYWIRASQSGQISLACATEATQTLAIALDKELNSSQIPVIQFNDASGVRKALYPAVRLKNEKDKLSYSMPPVPPSGVFDVRFSGDSRICEGEEGIIRVQSSNYPLTISASNITPEDGFQYVIKEILDGEEGKRYVLSEDNNVEITNPEVKTLKLSKEEIVPLTFMVQQNYPNPFNPETVIKYSIPENEKVEIVIYNSLGQKVKTLVSKNQEAGFYELVWNATNDYGNNVGSGIYFYRVKAGRYVAIKKMVLLR
jgi:hypothetical protein